MQQQHKQVSSLTLLHIMGHYSLSQWHPLTFMPIYSDEMKSLRPKSVHLKGSRGTMVSN